MTNPRKSRLGSRITRLEDRLAPTPPYEGQSWIWKKGRLHSLQTDEVFDSVEERGEAYAGRNMLFCDHVIVTPAKDGKPCRYSDKRYFDDPDPEEVSG